MARRYAPGMLIPLLILSLSSAAWASMSDYYFSRTSGTYQSLTTYNTALYGTTSSGTNGTFGDSAVSNWTSIGFGFEIDCGDYNYFSVSTNGFLVLSPSNTANLPAAGRYDALRSAPRYPVIAPFWQWAHLYDGGGCVATGVRYYTTGSAPNRVLTVEWLNQNNSQGTYYWAGCSTSMNQFQVKLYEANGRIEFHYSRIWNITTSASIGLAGSADDYVSVTPGSPPSSSTTSVNDIINNGYQYLTSGTIYSFEPRGACIVGRTGPGNGGTAAAADGDTLFVGFSEQLGNRAIYTPLEVVSMSTQTLTYRFQITGSAAADYTIEPAGSRNVDLPLTAGGVLIPQIGFAPTSKGIRYANLSVTNAATGIGRRYVLAAASRPRIMYSGNPAEGGTVAAADSDMFLSDIGLYPMTQGNFRPLRIDNVNRTPNYSTAPVNFTLSIDSSGASSTQYWLIDPVTGLPSPSITVAIGPGEFFVPVIQYRALSAGQQSATLRVRNSDNENRTYILGAWTIAPGGLFDVGNQPLAGSMQLRRSLTCVGAGSASVPLVITSSGYGAPLLVQRIWAYMIDTTIQQGWTPGTILRDELGQLIPMTDYFISDQQGSLTPLALPLSIPAGESRTVYLTFVGAHPGKRFARVFIQTNALNFQGDDINGTATTGLLSFFGLGSAVGSSLSRDADAHPLKPVVFAPARLRMTADTFLVIHNAGGCDLRISQKDLAITTGDVHEFSIVSALPNSRIDGTTGDFVIPAGGADSIWLRFTPARPGTRMATLRLVTNDSTILLPGLNDRGETYLDLSGYGRASLEGRDLVMDPVVIGGSVNGTAVFQNVENTPLLVTAIAFDGGDAAEFTAVGWPTLPITVLPTQTLELGVRFAPVGSPGTRYTSLVVVMASGDTGRLTVRGEAGTHELSVGPGSLFDNAEVQVGSSRRETVVITNTGTFPVRLERVEIVGVDAGNYRRGYLPRLDIEPGVTEYLEITFAPTTQAQSSADLEIVARGITYKVALGGTGQSAWDGDPEREPTPDGQVMTPARQQPGSRRATIR